MERSAFDYIYTIRLDQKQRHKLKIKYAILCSTIALLTYGVGFFETDSSIYFFITIPYALTILPVAFMLVGSFNIIGMVDFMVYNTYSKAFIWINKTSRLLLVLYALIVGSSIGILIFSKRIDNYTNEYIFISGIFIALVADYLLILEHRKNMKLIKKHLRNKN